MAAANSSLSIAIALSISASIVDVWILGFDLHSLVRSVTLLTSTRQCCLVELQAVELTLLFAHNFKLCHLLANVIAYAKFSFGRNYLIVLLIAQMFLAYRVITHDFTTLSLMFFNFR